MKVGKSASGIKSFLLEVFLTDGLGVSNYELFFFELQISFFTDVRRGVTDINWVSFFEGLCPISSKEESECSSKFV